MNKFRTHNCSELNKSTIDKKVVLFGMATSKKRSWKFTFIDLRDHYGITQCVIENENKFFPILEKTRPESVLKISGKVVARSKETINKDLKTGDIEVAIEDIDVLSHAKELPIPVFGEQDYPEDIRLKYRFLDLRREEMHQNIILRSRVLLLLEKKC